MNRTELQAKLKTYRAQGYALQVKLTAATRVLEAELERVLALDAHAYEQASAEECAIVPYQAEPCRDTAVKVAARIAARTVHAFRTHDYSRDVAIVNTMIMTAFLWIRAHQSELKSALKVADKVGEEIFVAVGMAAIHTYRLGQKARIEFDRWYPYVDSFRHYVIWLPMTRAIGNEDLEGYVWHK